MAKKDSFDLDGVIKRFEQTKSEIPKVFANDAQTFFESSFKKEGWTDATFKRWKPRQARRSVKKKDQTRRILVKNGDLRRDFSVKSATFNDITIANSRDYADYHNSGTSKMPQRQFMGHSQTLEKIQIKKIDKILKEIWK
jgi:hypothetical protein